MFKNDLKPHYTALLKAFARSFYEVYETIGVKFMPKGHIVLKPLEELIALSGRPLSAYSEQAVESQRRYNESYYSRFLVSPLTCDPSKEKLLKPGHFI